MMNAVHPDDRDRVTTHHGGVHGCGRRIRPGAPDDLAGWEHALDSGPGPDGQCGNGKRARTIGVSLDITSRKEAESEQVRLREEAVRASRAKDDFLATLSHELRTPLNPVLLVASDAAQDVDFPLEARSAFELIRKNVELEARLIDDLLDLTTIVRGKLAIKKEVRDFTHPE